MTMSLSSNLTFSWQSYFDKHVITNLEFSCFINKINYFSLLFTNFLTGKLSTSIPFWRLSLWWRLVPPSNLLLWWFGSSSSLSDDSESSASDGTGCFSSSCNWSMIQRRNSWASCQKQNKKQKLMYCWWNRSCEASTVFNCVSSRDLCFYFLMAVLSKFEEN